MPRLLSRLQLVCFFVMDSNWAKTKISSIFGGRYELEKIVTSNAHLLEGSGRDVISNDRVGLTVFAPHVNDHEDRTKEIYSAARSASKLEHINICSPQGWGQSDDCLYVVFDHGDGVSLAELLQKGVSFSQSQALVIALEVATALKHCHDLGITHGDLRPENIWIGADQGVRLSGFGLARSIFHLPADEAELIEASRYASPERAQGILNSPKGDIYGLGLIVKEVVTAKKPVVGDSLVASLMGRSEEALELDSFADPFGEVFSRCGDPDPHRRPEADELAQSLIEAAQSMARPGPFPTTEDAAKPLAEGKASVTAEVDSVEADTESHSVEAGPVGVDGYLGDDDDEEVTEEELAEVEAVAQALEQPSIDELLSTPKLIFSLDGDEDGHSEGSGEITSTSSGTVEDGESGEVGEVAPADQTGLVGELGESEVLYTPNSPGPATKALDALGPVDSVAKEPVSGGFDAPISSRGSAIRGLEYGDEADQVLPRWPVVVLLVLLAAASGLGLYFSGVLEDVASPTAPDFIGQEYSDVKAQAEDKGWDLVRLESRKDGTSVEEVISQIPAAGETLHRGDELRVTVSLGNEMVELPSDIFGLTMEQAQIRMNEFGIVLESSRSIHSESLSEGLVVTYDEPVNQKPAGESVAVVLSLGPEPRVIPQEIIGMAEQDAVDSLSALRLLVIPEPVYDPDAAIGSVLQSEPAPGQKVSVQAAVTIYVSAGPEPVAIPDVESLGLEEAITALEEVGLFFIGAEGTPGDPVIATIPEIGEIVEVGSEVTVVLGVDPDAEDSESEDGEDGDKDASDG